MFKMPRHWHHSKELVLVAVAIAVADLALINDASLSSTFVKRIERHGFFFL
jgi:hypothetical protein